MVKWKIKTEINDIEIMDNECKDYYEDLIFNNNLQSIESQLKKGNLDEAIDSLTKAVAV